jgi:hypothetical protein
LLDDSIACDILADLSDLRDYTDKFVKLQPMFGDALVEGKENPEKGTKLSTWISTRTDYMCKEYLKRSDRNPISSGTYGPGGPVRFDQSEDTYTTAAGTPVPAKLSWTRRYSAYATDAAYWRTTARAICEWAPESYGMAEAMPSTVGQRRWPALRQEPTEALLQSLQTKTSRKTWRPAPDRRQGPQKMLCPAGQAAHTGQACCRPHRRSPVHQARRVSPCSP